MNYNDFHIRPRLPEQFGRIQQVAYVVENIEEAARYWRDQEGVAPFLMCRNISPFTKGSFRGSPCSDVIINVGFSYIRGMQLELIEVCSPPPSIYHEALESYGLNVHHYAVHTSTFSRTYRWALENGYKAVLESGIDGLARMSYLEHDNHDFVIELIELNSLTHPYFEGIENRWNELDPSDGNADLDIMKLTKRSLVFRSLLKLAAKSMLGQIDKTR